MICTCKMSGIPLNSIICSYYSYIKYMIAKRHNIYSLLVFRDVVMVVYVRLKLHVNNNIIKTKMFVMLPTRNLLTESVH